MKRPIIAVALCSIIGGAVAAAPAHADYWGTCDAQAALFASTMATPGTTQWTTIYNNYIKFECVPEHPEPPPSIPTCGRTPCNGYGQ